MFGFLNIDKPVGMTSFAVVAKLRKILGVKKIGHAGTLDPFAQGVLPIAVGKATRLIDYLSNEKSYNATVQFGFDTDTYDKDGQIVCTYAKKVTEQEIIGILPEFIGEISQIPPKFSAIKIDGKRLYDLARKGQTIEKIPSRKVKIKKLEILDFDFEKQILKIEVDCSKGTYIRSLAYDMGQKLNCGAYLTELIRTNSSGFLLKNSCKLDDENLREKLLNPLKYLKLPTFEISDEQLKKVIVGQSIKIDIDNTDNLLLLNNGNIVAIGSVNNTNFSVNKVFYEKD